MPFNLMVSKPYESMAYLMCHGTNTLGLGSRSAITLRINE